MLLRWRGVSCPLWHQHGVCAPLLLEFALHLRNQTQGSRHCRSSRPTLDNQLSMLQGRPGVIVADAGADFETAAVAETPLHDGLVMSSEMQAHPGGHQPHPGAVRLAAPSLQTCRDQPTLPVKPPVAAVTPGAAYFCNLQQPPEQHSRTSANQGCGHARRLHCFPDCHD